MPNPSAIINSTATRPPISDSDRALRRELVDEMLQTQARTGYQLDDCARAVFERFADGDLAAEELRGELVRLYSTQALN